MGDVVLLNMYSRSTVYLVLCGVWCAVPCTVSVALLLGDGPTPLLALQV